VVIRWRCVLGIAASAITVLSITAQPPRPATPSELEAVYLYHFAKFVTWPPEAVPQSVPFAICTLGNDEFNGALETAASNEPLQGRKVLMRHLTSIAEAEGCHILFIAPSEEAHLSKQLGSVKGRPILTVGSSPDFLERGGMIQFILEENRVRFAINLNPATESHLTVSSELLKLAVTVEGKPAEEAK
jgi:hypothetical protein